jgi:hypothetical protein
MSVNQEKKVIIEVTVHEVASILSKHMVQGSSGEDRAVTNLIIGHLALTEKGLPQLFKALMGVFPSLIYKEKDWVYVRLDMLPSWKMNKIATAALPSVKNEYILAQIIECNVYKTSQYKLAYDVIKDGETVAKQDTSEIREEYILEKAEDFVDILDALEKLKEEQDKPF